MKRIRVPVFLAISFGFASAVACSDESGGGRAPTASGGSSSGGKTSVGETGSGQLGGGSSTGGKPVSGASGGASSGGANTGGVASGGGLNLENCDTAAVAALFASGRRCVGCHFSVGLHIFDTVQGLSDVVNVTRTKSQSMNCASQTIVVPGNAAQSLLYVKLAGTPPMECGAQMPKKEGAQAQKSLTAQELKCVADWINGLPAGGAGGQAGASGN